MYQFDTYIDSILNDLNISKKQKNEMAEEFKDHLEGLKQEFIIKGFTEDEAAVKAIENFGNCKELRKKLNSSMLDYRTKPNILFGIGYVLFAILFCKISLDLFAIQYVDRAKPLEYIQILSISAVLDIIITSPIGYFLPIIFKRVRKIRQIASINIFIFLSSEALFLFISGTPLNVIIKESLSISVATITLFIVGLFSGILGYKMLNIVNNKTWKFRGLVSK